MSRRLLYTRKNKINSLLGLKTKPTSFYHFRQNNSGGRFVVDEKKGINVNVVIEAYSVEEANEIAERIGLYFNGVDDGFDCSCCGDRWYSPFNSYPFPHVYGKEIDDESETFIHYLDGWIEKC